jgi:hypothetical protein
MIFINPVDWLRFILGHLKHVRKYVRAIEDASRESFYEALLLCKCQPITCLLAMV